MLALRVVSLDGKPYPTPYDAEFDESGGSIGRRPDNRLALSHDLTVSTVHATIRFNDGQYFLIPQGRNSTRLNGRRLNNGIAETLSDGDKLALGASVLAVVIKPRQEIVRHLSFTILEDIARDVQLAASSQLRVDDREHRRFEHAALVMLLLEPRIGKQQVEAIDLAGCEHAIEIDPEVAVRQHEVAQALGRGSARAELHDAIADVEAHHQRIWARAGQRKTELGVRTAELDLDRRMRPEVGRPHHAVRPRQRIALRERVHVLPDASGSRHRSEAVDIRNRARSQARDRDGRQFLGSASGKTGTLAKDG